MKPRVVLQVAHRYEELRQERRALIAAIWATTLATEAQYQKAVGELRAWDAAHAEEWNRIKPWFEARLFLGGS